MAGGPAGPGQRLRGTSRLSSSNGATAGGTMEPWTTTELRPMTAWIHGPLISTDNLDAHERLFSAFGMVPRARRALDAAECARQWGTPAGTRATELVLDTPGTRYGARILQFEPASPTVVRDPQRGYDADAPKVIDFYVPDFQAAVAAVEGAGFVFRQPFAEYDLPEGHIIEAHVWGPDQVVCALMSGPHEFFRAFATVTDRMFSEPQSLSGVVSELEPSIAFFTEVFGFEVVYRYGIDDDSFRRLVGSERPQFNLRSVNVGVNTQEPYFGLIHYGLPEGSYESLAGRARPPHRGNLGATILHEDLDGVLARCAGSGGQVLAPAALIETAAFGQRRGALLQAPNGGCYQVLAAD